MTRFLVAPFAVVALVSALLITTSAILAGQAVYQPKPLTLDLAGSADCKLPCWFGIIPGETYLSSAVFLLKDAGYTLYSSGTGISEYHPIDSRRCTVRLIAQQEMRLDGEIDGRIIEIRLLRCRSIVLGDTMLVLKQPQVTSTGGARLSFLDGAAHVYPRSAACNERRLTPFMRVDAVIITLQAEPHEAALRWHGFAPYEAYRGSCFAYGVF